MKDYIKLATRTEPSEEQYAETLQRLAQPETIRLLHSFIGKATEVGELLDALKKHIFYGKELDVVNIAEEFGDDKWYSAIGTDALADMFGIPAEELDDKIEIINIEKLQTRYPGKFSESDAINRDTSSEREILDQVVVNKCNCSCGCNG